MVLVSLARLGRRSQHFASDGAEILGRLLLRTFLLCEASLGAVETGSGTHAAVCINDPAGALRVAQIMRRRTCRQLPSGPALAQVWTHFIPYAFGVFDISQ